MFSGTKKFFKGRTYLAAKEAKDILRKWDCILTESLYLKTHSQFGEDFIVDNLFTTLKISNPSYLDLGANHPFEGSNTALFYLKGGTGVVVDANPNYINIWQATRPNDQFVNVGIGKTHGELEFYMFNGDSGRNTFDKKTAEGFMSVEKNAKIREIKIIKVVPVNDIVQQYLNGEWPNFLSIDLEGLDLEVLESADFSKTHPDIICVEITSGDNQKDSDEEMIALLRKKDFFPVFQTGGNIIAVHNSFKNKFAIY